MLPRPGRTPHHRQAHASPRPALKRAATQNDRRQQGSHGAPDLARAALVPTCPCQGCKSRGRSAACNRRGRRKRACARPGDSPVSVLPACYHSVRHQTRAVSRRAHARTRKLDADLGSGTSKAATGSVGSVGGKRFGCALDATSHSILLGKTVSRPSPPTLSSAANTAVRGGQGFMLHEGAP